MAFLQPLKPRIREGEVLVGAAMSLIDDSARMEQVLEHEDYDFFHVDTQHVPFNEERLQSFCRTAAKLDKPVIVRIKHPRHAYLVGAIADLGPSGIEVPEVKSTDVADEACRFFYYPPTGERSSGGASVRALGFIPTSGSNARIEYAGWWNENGLLMLQVESLEAVMMAKEFAQPGVDCLSWGAAPNSADLAFSLENNPNHFLKTDDDCLAYTIEQLRGTATRMFVRISGPAQREKYLKMGATVFRETPPGSTG